MLKGSSFLICLLLSTTTLLFSCSKNDSNPSPKATQSAEPSEFSGSPGDCKEFIKALPENYFHDWVYVPENPFDSNSQKIQVFYYGPKNLTDNVVIFYNGGPGSDSHGTHIAFEKQMQDFGMTNKISFIYMDQRGTGCSSGYPYQKTDENILRSRWYGSTGIVYDSEAIRQRLLGDKKWKVFGQSYGAFIVHRYVTLFPQSVEAAYAHANTINADPQLRLYNRIFSQYRVLNMYFDQYPDDRAKFLFLKNYLTASQCVVTRFNGNFCGHETLASMVMYLGFSNRWAKLHNFINAIVASNTDNKLKVDSEKLKQIILTYFDQESAPSGYAISVIGYFDRNVASTDYSHCKLVYDKFYSSGISEDQILLNECMPAMQTKAESIRLQKIKAILNNTTDILTLDNFKIGLQKLNPFKFFLYSGEKDAFVPKETFPEELAAVGPLLNYTHFMGSGHEGFRTEKQVWDDLIK